MQNYVVNKLLEHMCLYTLIYIIVICIHIQYTIYIITSKVCADICGYGAPGPGGLGCRQEQVRVSRQVGDLGRCSVLNLKIVLGCPVGAFP